ncbi:MAG: zinc-binding dehydrogenase [Pseudobdellovibrionaceae bacterium]
MLSHSDRKREDALKMGAHNFVSTQDKKIFRELANSFDLIINTISIDINMGGYFSLLKLDGTLVVVGLPTALLSIWVRFNNSNILMV